MATLSGRRSFYDAQEEKVDAINNNRELQEKLEHALEEQERPGSMVKGVAGADCPWKQGPVRTASEKASVLFRNIETDADPLEENAPCDEKEEGEIPCHRFVDNADVCLTFGSGTRAAC